MLANPGQTDNRCVALVPSAAYTVTSGEGVVSSGWLRIIAGSFAATNDGPRVLGRCDDCAV
jgi:hypothetical protein